MDFRENLKLRWDSIVDKNGSFVEVNPDIPNKNLYFSNMILNEPDEIKADERLRALEEADKMLKKLREDKELQKKWKEAREKRNSLLYKYDWTQLADCPLDREQKVEYRAYRKYLRDFPMLYKNQQVLTLDVMEFEEWQIKKPVY